ncbi:unnamed protein product [Ectocarpus sp. 12 AP-2014]
MARPHGKPARGALNVISSLLLYLSVGRLLFVLRPGWNPSRNQQPKIDQLGQGPPAHGYHHRRTTSQNTAYSAGRRGQAMPAELQMHLSNSLHGSGGPDDFPVFGDPRSFAPPGDRRDSVGGFRVSNRGSSGIGGASHTGLDHRGLVWGKGMRVLIYTMDSIQTTVAKSMKGGPAGEIIIRESLTRTLTEAGVEVEVATSDGDFERRAEAMDIYNAVVIDPWTWAGKGWRLKSQLEDHRGKMFVLDYFGSDEPHANLGVPLKRHLTAFPISAEHQRTFLGYRVDPNRKKTPLSKPAAKRRQGVIWGKTKDKLFGNRRLILALADMVVLHSTVAPEDAFVMHDNIVYHGHLPPDEWNQLLQESKFIIGLGNPLLGPSAVDAVTAGCAYLNPIFLRPEKKVYNSQHPFLAQRVGEPYVCSFEQHNAYAAVDCARRALEQDLSPMIPQELTKASHATRVREIFEPLLVTSLQ